MSDLSPRLPDALRGRYRIEERIGRGGMGTVFRATDEKHRRQVAVKVFEPGSATSEHRDRFLREIEIAAGLNHPHISPVFDSGEADGFLFFVMPLMEGDTLRDVIEREAPLPVDRALVIATQLIAALGFAHERGVIHRDVKPENVLFSDGHAVLADFGVAKAMEEAWGALTTTGGAPGTPWYMSPEQLSGDAVIDRRSDLYSVACVLYEMLAGHRPFAGTSRMSILARKVTETPQPIETQRADITPSVATALQKALSVEPDDRFQSATEFADSLRPGIPSAPRARRRTVTTVVAVAGLAMAAFIGLRATGGDDLTDRSGSVVVLPFGDAIQAPEERALVIDLADELTRQLNRWDSVRAVPQVSLTGVAFDLGIDGPVLSRVDDGQRIAQALGVEGLLTLNVRIRGDSAEVTATRFGPQGRALPGRPLETRGAVSDPFRLAAGIAHELLGLTGPIEAVENLRRQSSNLEAHRRYSEGVRLLELWRLQEAVQAFRAATELDPAFAMAHYHLAVGLYWQAARDPDGLGVRGPDAARLAREALRNADDLPSRDREHVIAFSRFLDGSYEEARRTYAGLVAADSTDAYAWLLGGIVEYADPWLIEAPDGSLRPRADWNAAVEAFTEATRLSPDFHLGYGHLFDIAGDVLRTVEGPRGKGRYRPLDEDLAPWQDLSDPSLYEAFYPVYGDTISWLSDEEFQGSSRAALTEGATRLLERSIRTLRRWAAYAPEQPQPHSELARWTLRQRALIQAPTAPGRLDSLALEARGHAERALALSPDTVVTDRVRLANLYLATGAFTEAEATADRLLALAQYDGRAPTPLINMLVHSGRWESALTVLEGEGAPRLFIPDPDTGELFGDGGAEPVVRRLVILGATGVDDAALTRELDDLEQLWVRPPPGTAPLAALRAHEAPRVAAALVSDPDALARWRSAAELDTPFWDAIDPSVETGLEAVRLASLQSPSATEPSEPTRSFLLADAALRSGDPELALRLYHRVDSIPLTIEALDVGWGFKSRAHFGRGTAYEALGDPMRAATSYRTFLETRTESTENAPFSSAARRRLEALPTGN